MPEDRSDRTSTASNAHKQQSTSSSARQEGTGRSTSERERPIESGRERERQDHGGTGIVRHRGTAPVRGGVGWGAEPFTLMRRMAADMDRLFEQLGFGRTGLGLGSRLPSLFDDDLWSGRALPGQTSVWSPQVETFRRGDNFVIRADIPGIKKDDVHVEIDGDMLTISGERREEHEDGGDRDGFYRSERSYGEFYRAIPLPEGANPDQVDARFEDGVLEVTVPAPMPQEKRAKRIQVK